MLVYVERFVARLQTYGALEVTSEISFISPLFLFIHLHTFLILIYIYFFFLNILLILHKDIFFLPFNQKYSLGEHFVFQVGIIP